MTPPSALSSSGHGMARMAAGLPLAERSRSPAALCPVVIDQPVLLRVNRANAPTYMTARGFHFLGGPIEDQDFTFTLSL
jgi:hypothetical protein